MQGKYLGIDIGTTSVKAGVFNEKGERIAIRSVDYTLDTDPARDFIEFDPQRYVDICKSVIDELCLECGKIDALSVDTQGETLILTDGDGVPVYPAVVWLDNRAHEQAKKIEKDFGRECVYNVTGQPEITAGWPASKLLWFKEKMPDVWGRVKKIFMLEDYILYSLTGNFVTEPTIQSSSVYFDIRERRWWGRMLDYLGVSVDQLPTVVKTGTAVGEYKGITVVTGMLDQIAGTIGAGVVSPNVISEMTGTIMAICVLTDKIPPYQPDSIVPCHLHAIEGKYCLILWSATAGMALKWFKNEFAESFSFKELDEIAKGVPAGCDGLVALPYFCGSTMPKYNPEARASFTGITMSHTRAHFARAIMESIAFLLKQNLEYAGAMDAEQIRITGGGASSPLWAQIKADVTGKVLKTVSESETACLGSALVSALGVGAFDSIEQASASAVVPKREYLPSGTDYTKAYELYKRFDGLLNKREND